MIPADAPSVVHWNDRPYLLAGARHWLETRDRDYPRLIEDHKLAQALAVEKLERARCIVAQWLWVCDPANPPAPAFGDHGLFGALNVDLAAEIAEAASVARYRAGKRPADARAAMLADLYEALAWWQQPQGESGLARIVFWVEIERNDRARRQRAPLRKAA